jgi:hypothetical protein
MNGRHHSGGSQWGVPELVGRNPAVDSALAAVANTPAFAQLVQQHAAAMGYHAGAAPMGGMVPGTVGGPGVAYGGTNVQVTDRPLLDIRELAIGFLQTGIAAGANFNVVTRPQVVFRGERLVVPTSPSGSGTLSIAQSFSILDLKIGNRSQLVAAQSLPAQAFIETGVGVRLSLDTAAIAQDVVIIVNNTTAAAATFQAVIFGTSAQ